MTLKLSAKPAMRDPAAHSSVPSARSLSSLNELDKMAKMKAPTIRPAVKQGPNHEY
jgi:hypothetical protein